jgi:2-(1,2-epoxy-1,2-dihydrophenyl)acetyl-CoA isomerase
MENIKLEKINSIATITFNRPTVFNAFNKDMRNEMLAALDDCQNDPSVRCVLITGAGKAFCAGTDLAEVSDFDNAPPLKEVLDEGYNAIVLKIRQLEKPVVAAVNGVAAGAGANMALACDIVIAHENARFIQAFSKIGLIPDSGGTWVLPRLIGFAKASALMMLGESVTAKEAENMGMIYKVFSEETYLENVEKTVNTLAQMPTRGLALTKQVLNESIFKGFDNQLSNETAWQALAGETHDYREGVTAFIEKRKPVFLGK